MRGGYGEKSVGRRVRRGGENGEEGREEGGIIVSKSL
jgi:hypothetical protein